MVSIEVDVESPPAWRRVMLGLRLSLLREKCPPMSDMLSMSLLFCQPYKLVKNERKNFSHITHATYQAFACKNQMLHHKATPLRSDEDKLKESCS